jgi:hypothetical protein
MNFVHDQLFDAKKVRELTTVDAFTRYSHAIEPGSTGGEQVSSKH